MEHNEKGRVTVLRNQKRERINGKRTSLLKLPNFDFLVWEIIFPVLAMEVCVTGTGGLNTERLLFSLTHWGDLVLPWA